MIFCFCVIISCRRGIVKKEQAATRRVFKLEPITIIGTPDDYVELERFDEDSLYKEATKLYRNGEYKKALRYLNFFIGRFPDSKYIYLAHFFIAMCLENLGRYKDAIEAYRNITEIFPESSLSVSAIFKKARLLAKINKYDEIVKDMLDVLKRKDITYKTRIEANVDLGISLFMLGEMDSADVYFRDAIRIYEKVEKEQSIEATSLISQAFFYRGEIRFRKMNKIKLKLPEKKMKEDLEKKAELLLEAQSFFLRSIRAGDPGWAIASGSRIGKMYHSLYNDMINAEIPEDLDEEAKKIYIEELKKRISVLLKKALRAYSVTIDAADRLGVDNEWYKKMKQDMNEIQRMLLTDDVLFGGTG